ncbi:stearoyl-CoA desaturase (delta-9 desaturase) [Inmirania thermothiophila]|uniref:Stearoyl-CoA desaturase (Delta-9 desaturase) n=1 Tax=Inmirania thermothiophila TaxID=1750597 RepID=A0A3N1Y634_9GAMM|nr:fatty acid desaturase [Inmirania thermothiophila]ROR34269.1 stearoyl-CoA desaturase (delta-9 desaturase) [Inmirania thermothiophila]
MNDLLDGVTGLGWGGIVLYVLATTHVTIAAVTIFLHRAQAHRALDLHPAVSHFFRFWLWLTTGMVTKEWVAVHRKHHTHCETEDDPHSPQVLGLPALLTRGTELYRAAAADVQTLERFGRGTPDDWLERHLYSRHPTLGITLLALADLVLFGPLGLTAWAVQMLWIPVLAAGVINGIGHYVGYRNFATEDASRNILPWGVLIGGEELHNNHHAYPGSARLSARPWEFDIGWLYIRILEMLGLARVKRTLPQLAWRGEGEALDLEAARACAAARLELASRYVRHVLVPVLREELRGPAWRRLARRLRGLPADLDGALRRELETAAAASPRLRAAWEGYLELKAQWASAGSYERLRDALEAWRRRAEASGVEAMRRFARELAGLRLRGAKALA